MLPKSSEERLYFAAVNNELLGLERLVFLGRRLGMSDKDVEALCDINRPSGSSRAGCEVNEAFTSGEPQRSMLPSGFHGRKHAFLDLK